MYKIKFAVTGLLVLLFIPICAYGQTPETAAGVLGKPMKLKDPGTILAKQVIKTKFQEREVLSLTVTYDESVGSDIWYFYFDPTNYRLVGYRFYHDESKNDGEYITLEDEYLVGKMRLPKIRKWYMNVDQKYLGTDILSSYE